MLGIFHALFWHMLTFFKINFFKKFFQKLHKSVKQSETRSRLTFYRSWSGSKVFARVSRWQIYVTASQESVKNRCLMIKQFKKQYVYTFRVNFPEWSAPSFSWHKIKFWKTQFECKVKQNYLLPKPRSKRKYMYLFVDPMYLNNKAGQ